MPRASRSLYVASATVVRDAQRYAVRLSALPCGAAVSTMRSAGLARRVLAGIALAGQWGARQSAPARRTPSAATRTDDRGDVCFTSSAIRADVLADDPQHDQLDAADEADEDHRRTSTPGRRSTPTSFDTTAESPNRIDADRDEEAEVQRQPQRAVGETDDRVGREPDHAAERVLAPTWRPAVGSRTATPSCSNPTQLNIPRR